jgi:hypothetical protein
MTGTFLFDKLLAMIILVILPKYDNDLSNISNICIAIYVPVLQTGSQ